MCAKLKSVIRTRRARRGLVIIRINATTSAAALGHIRAKETCSTAKIEACQSAATLRNCGSRMGALPLRSREWDRTGRSMGLRQLNVEIGSGIGR